MPSTLIPNDIRLMIADPANAAIVTELQTALANLLAEYTSQGYIYSCPKCGGLGVHQRYLDTDNPADTDLVVCQAGDTTVNCAGRGFTNVQLHIKYPISFEPVTTVPPVVNTMDVLTINNAESGNYSIHTKIILASPTQTIFDIDSVYSQGIPTPLGAQAINDSTAQPITGLLSLENLEANAHAILVTIRVKDKAGNIIIDSDQTRTNVFVGVGQTLEYSDFEFGTFSNGCVVWITIEDYIPDFTLRRVNNSVLGTNPIISIAIAVDSPSQALTNEDYIFEADNADIVYSLNIDTSTPITGTVSLRNNDLPSNTYDWTIEMQDKLGNPIEDSSFSPSTGNLSSLDDITEITATYGTSDNGYVMIVTLNDPE